jgi:hypothetical protein
VSFEEIIEELPKLTAEQRAAVWQRLRELEEKDEMTFLHESADLMFRETDKQLLTKKDSSETLRKAIASREK